VQLPFTFVLDRRRLSARLLTRGDVSSLTLHADGRCVIGRTDGVCDEARIDPETTTVLAWLIVLHYRVSDRRESLILPVAAIGSEAHRRLRVWLRWSAISNMKRHEPA
jgi:hypothetical protein